MFQPEQAGADMHSMKPNDGEEGGQEGAAVGSCYCAYHRREISRLECQKGKAQNAGDQQRKLSPELAARDGVRPVAGSLRSGNLTGNFSGVFRRSGILASN